MSATVGTSTGISLSVTKTNTSCGASNGSATVTPSGASTYTYVWKNSSSVTISTSKTVSNLAAGTYTVCVTGNNGCTSYSSVTINSSNPLTVTLHKTHPSCGLSNGSISLSPTGSDTYTYIWKNSSNVQIGTGKTISNLASGTYSYKVTGNSVCISEGTVTLTNSQTSCNVTLSGNVFNDVNALIGTPANTVDGSSTNLPTGLYASLVSGTTILQTVPVTNGTYSFGNVSPNTTYSVVLSNNASGSTTASLPTNWVNTGENLGTAAGNDGTVNGILSNIAVGTSNVVNANLGINRLPDGADVTLAPQQNPGGTTKVDVPSTVFTGIDPEDGTYADNLLGRIVKLSPGTNGLVYYNNVLVSSSQTITNFNPALVKFDPINGIVTGSFIYTVQDNAGFDDPAPNTVFLPFISIPNLVPRITFDNFIVSSIDTTSKVRQIEVSVSNIRAFSSTSGLVTILVTKKPAYFSNEVLNPLQTVNSLGQTLSNSLFTLDAISDPDWYIITTNAVLNGVGTYRFAFSIQVNPLEDSIFQIQAKVVDGSGGENVFTDNLDDEAFRLILE